MILFYVGMVKNSSGLLRTMLAQGATDLAYDCLQETAKRVDVAVRQELTALKQTVQASRCHQLEHLLKTQHWREADRETYRLMITTIGKEEGQWFDRADLENFPCEDLRTIDQLWVKYSNGKWGFGVQKRIWQECGSPMNYNDEWLKFVDRIGWRKDGKWLDEADLTYDLEKSPSGEFPMGRKRCVEWSRWFSSLAQRLVNCSTSQP